MACLCAKTEGDVQSVPDDFTPEFNRRERREQRFSLKIYEQSDRNIKQFHVAQKLRSITAVAGAIAEWHTQRISTKLIEQHLTDLQRRVASLEAAIKSRPRDAWKQIIGISKGQPLDREAARLGAEWRAKENKRK
jgi:hypothetical protein